MSDGSVGAGGSKEGEMPARLMSEYCEAHEPHGCQTASGSGSGGGAVRRTGRGVHVSHVASEAARSVRSLHAREV